MKRWIGITAKVLIWLVLMGTYFNLFVVNNKAAFAIDTDWFSIPSNIWWPCDGGDSHDLIGCVYEEPIAYYSRGFPILMSSRYTEGPFALAWVINIGFTILVGISLALLLMGKFKKAAIAGGILVLIYGLLAVIVSLF